MTGEARRTRTGIKEEARKGNRPEPRIQEKEIEEIKKRQRKNEIKDETGEKLKRKEERK